MRRSPTKVRGIDERGEGGGRCTQVACTQVPGTVQFHCLPFQGCWKKKTATAMFTNYNRPLELLGDWREVGVGVGVPITFRSRLRIWIGCGPPSPHMASPLPSVGFKLVGQRAPRGHSRALAAHRRSTWWRDHRTAKRSAPRDRRTLSSVPVPPPPHRAAFRFFPPPLHPRMPGWGKLGPISAHPSFTPPPPLSTSPGGISGIVQGWKEGEGWGSAHLLRTKGIRPKPLSTKGAGLVKGISRRGKEPGTPHANLTGGEALVFGVGVPGEKEEWIPPPRMVRMDNEA